MIDYVALEHLRKPGLCFATSHLLILCIIGAFARLRAQVQDAISMQQLGQASQDYS